MVRFTPLHPATRTNPQKEDHLLIWLFEESRVDLRDVGFNVLWLVLHLWEELAYVERCRTVETRSSGN